MSRRDDAPLGVLRAIAVALAFAAVLSADAPADAGTLRYAVHTRSWDVPGKRVERAGRAKSKFPGITASIYFGSQDGVPDGQMLVRVPGGSVDLELRGPFDRLDRAKHNVAAQTAALRGAVLAMAAPGFGPAGVPADAIVDIRRAVVVTRGRWKTHYAGFFNTTFTGLTEFFRLKVKVVADVSDPSDPLRKPVRVRSVFKGRYRKFYPSGQSPNPGPGTGPGPLCPWSDALAGTGVVRDRLQPPPSSYESQLLQALDANLYQDLTTAPIVNTYQADIGLMAVRAGLGSVSITTVSDMRLSAPRVRGFGGGMAGHGFLVIDGKLLDVLADYARYVALREAGVAFANDDGMLNDIVARHNAVFGANPLGLSFMADALTPSQTVRAREVFLRSAAPMLYHEFGHLFLWNSLDRLRASTGQLPSYFLASSLNEDDADRVTGALVRKSGGTAADIAFLYDVLTFYTYARGGAVTTIQQVRSSQVQNVSPTPTYSTPAGRKSTARSTFYCE